MAVGRPEKSPLRSAAVGTRRCSDAAVVIRVPWRGSRNSLFSSEPTKEHVLPLQRRETSPLFLQRPSAAEISLAFRLPSTIRRRMLLSRVTRSPEPVEPAVTLFPPTHSAAKRPNGQLTFLGPTAVQHDDQFMPKIDYITGKNQLSGRYFFTNSRTLPIYPSQKKIFSPGL